MTIDNSNLAKNNRISARGDYTRWLAQRFGSINLMTTQEGQDRVSLSKIYVPIRLDKKDREEQSIGSPDKVDEETSLGEDARDIIASERITVISGRPGSGKTTLTQALIYELCYQKNSEFRTKLIGDMFEQNEELGFKKSQSVLPVPLILRNYQQELMQVESFDELLNTWWQKAWEEVQDKSRYGKHRLDIEQLKQSVDPQGDNIPLLIIFDGIDEVGGEQREIIIGFVEEAIEQGHRVVLTGRPTGFVDFQVSVFIMGPEGDRGGTFVPFNISYVQPFSWKEINHFIEQIYRVSDEWKNLREQGITQFDQALRDPQRSYLLNLARRPIFLTLMSLVHINDTAMPHGRANLYERIIDLYLVRQTQHKRLTNTKEGKPIPSWNDKEVRRALGYLAWRSQMRSVDNKDDDIDRQVIWSKQEMLLELQTLLTEQKNAFVHIQVEDAADLLNYYLHPAGLLIEPAEQQIQFSHLSFQEYLCAEYLHGLCTSKGFKRFTSEVESQLLVHLDNPGWDEIALLFLTIHSAQGQQSQATAHFEILAELDITKLSQAKLLLTAYCGKELRFTDQQRLDWLPLILMACLIHRDDRVANKLQQLEPVSANYKDLLLALINADNVPEYLSGIASKSMPEGFFGEQDIEGWFSQTKDAWLNSKDTQNSMIFSLMDATKWLYINDKNPAQLGLCDSAVGPLVNWINKQSLWFVRDKDNIPRLTDSICSLSRIGSHSPTISAQLNEKLPLDWMLICREFVEASDYSIDILGLTAQKQCIKANRIRLFHLFIQMSNVTDYLGIDTFVNKLNEIPNFEPIKVVFSFKELNLMSKYLFDIFCGLSYSAIDVKIIDSITSRYNTSLKEKNFFNDFESILVSKHHKLAEIATLFMLHCRARTWFDKQSNNELGTSKVGLNPKEPLPKHLGLFDQQGIPLTTQSRASWLALNEWLDDDHAILDFAFPEGLSEPERVGLIDDLQILKPQPWSPSSIVSRTLADWPETEPSIVVSTQALADQLYDEGQRVLAQEKKDESS
ncbi:MAG: hypothetical protein ACI8WB_001001 [Phenylobacterium sp.]|jgi:hypothetical protein